MIACNICGTENPEGSLICDSCSEPLYPNPADLATNRCPSCGLKTNPQDSFCTSCGSPTNSQQIDPILQPDFSIQRTLSLEDGTLITSIPVGTSKIIGRSSTDCDIGITDLYDSDFLSRRHIRVEAEMDGFIVEDLKSTNNTYLDGGLLPPGSRVKAGIGSKIELARKITLIVG